jgi:hypothetical protein
MNDKLEETLRASLAARAASSQPSFDLEPVLRGSRRRRRQRAAVTSVVLAACAAVAVAVLPHVLVRRAPETVAGPGNGMAGWVAEPRALESRVAAALGASGSRVAGQRLPAGHLTSGDWGTALTGSERIAGTTVRALVARPGGLAWEVTVTAEQLAPAATLAQLRAFATSSSADVIPLATPPCTVIGGACAVVATGQGVWLVAALKDGVIASVQITSGQQPPQVQMADLAVATLQSISAAAR